MRLAYFVHDLSDAAVGRRVRMLRHAGAEVLVLGFRRTPAPPEEVAGAPVADLGRTFDGEFRQRAVKVAAQLLKTPAMKAALTGCEVVVARNLEMLVIAAAARTLHAPRSRLVYECLDIHRLMTSRRAVGAVLRGLERSLMAQSQLMILSSPGHLTDYFEPFQKLGRTLELPVALVENKVLELGPAAAGRRAPRPAGPPWRIGWFGMLRCRRSFEILSGLAARRPGLVEVRISGRPSAKEFPDFTAEAARAPGVTFTGGYRPEDLAGMYHAVHFNWAIDFFEAGANSEWLLPNRIYEGGRHGAAPIALRHTATGRWLAEHGLGLLVSDPAPELDRFFQGLDESGYRSLERPSLEAPEAWFTAGPADCRELLHAMAGAA